MFYKQHNHCIAINKSAVMLLLINSAAALFLSPAFADINQYDGLTALDTKAIKTVLLTHSVTGTSPESGFSFTVYYPAYGKLEGEAGPWGLYQDQGAWSVKDGIYCARWDHWLDNAERCYRVYTDEDAIYWVTLDGVLQSRDTLIRAGKSE